MAYKIDLGSDLTFWFPGVPEGYELVETEEHKKQRLQDELNDKKALLAGYEKRLASLTSEIETTEKELKALEA